MKRIPLARNAAFNPFPSYLHQGGADVERILKALHVNLETLTNHEGLLPFEYACRFVKAVEGVEGMEQLGLKVGENTSVLSLGDFGLYLANAVTLEDLLERLVKAVPMTNSAARAWLSEGVSAESISLNLQHDDCPARASLDGFALLVLIDAVRQAAGKDWCPSHIALDSEAGDLSRFTAISGAIATRDVHHISFDIPKNLLDSQVDSPNHPDEPSVHSKLSDSAPSADLLGSIEQTVRAGLGGFLPSIEETAALAGVSVRTLQNNLKENKLVYREVTSQVRFKEAKRLLLEGKMYVNEIAAYLGYNDTSNFNHAFKKWTGSSPKSFVQNHQNNK